MPHKGERRTAVGRNPRGFRGGTKRGVALATEVPFREGTGKKTANISTSSGFRGGTGKKTATAKMSGVKLKGG